MSNELLALLEKTFADNQQLRTAAVRFFQQEGIDTIDGARRMSRNGWNQMVEGLAIPLRRALGLTSDDKPYTAMRLQELVEALAIGDRDPGLIQALRAIGVDTLLVDAEGKLREPETVRVLGSSLRPVPGSLWGRERFRVITLSEFIAEQIELEPLSLHLLVEGFDNATGLDWNQVPKDVRLFLRFATHQGQRRDVHDVMDDLDEANHQLSALAKQRRWSLLHEQYLVAKERDRTLEARLLTELYPQKGQASPSPGGAVIDTAVSLAEKPKAPLRQAPLSVTGQPMKDMLEALTDAFPTHQSYNQLLQLGLELNPDSIASTEQDLRSRFYELLVYCSARGSIPHVLQAAENQNGESPKLRELLKRYPPLRSVSVWDKNRERRLRQALVAVYPESRQARRVVLDARVLARNVSYVVPIIDIWTAVINDAALEQGGALDRILEVALSEFPHNEHLRNV